MPRRIVGASGRALAVALALAASGCMMARGEYPQPAPTAAARPAAGQPLDLTATAATGGPQVGAGGPPAAADAGAQAVPMALADPTATPAATSGQPDNELLTPEEKARLIDELETLAQSQTARAAGTKTECSDQTVDGDRPDAAQALNGDFAAAGC